MTDRKKTIRNLEELNRWATINLKYGIGMSVSECKKAVEWIGDVIQLLKERDAIVRCKDCRYGEPVKNGAGDDCIQCNNDDLWLDGSVNFPDWFCADGERKNDDG